MVLSAVLKLAQEFQCRIIYFLSLWSSSLHLISSECLHCFKYSQKLPPSQKIKLSLTSSSYITASQLSAESSSHDMMYPQSHVLLALTLIAASSQVNIRTVEKKIIDDILGSKAYDNRIRPQGEHSKSKLEEIFCRRDASTWSWKRCQFAKSDSEQSGQLHYHSQVN